MTEQDHAKAVQLGLTPGSSNPLGSLAPTPNIPPTYPISNFLLGILVGASKGSLRHSLSCNTDVHAAAAAAAAWFALMHDVCYCGTRLYDLLLLWTLLLIPEYCCLG